MKKYSEMTRIARPYVVNWNTQNSSGSRSFSSAAEAKVFSQHLDRLGIDNYTIERKKVSQ